MPQAGETAPLDAGSSKATATWWPTFLLFLLGASWGLQFTLLKISTEASLGELGILTVCMVLLAAAYMVAVVMKRGLVSPDPGRLGALDWIEERPPAEGGQTFHDLNAGHSPAAKIVLRP